MLLLHLFRTRNQYYFYDANTCSIIRINETMYDILKNKENFLELEQLKKLYENGFLQSKEDIIIEHPASSGIESYLDEGMQQLILQLTQNCNLRCKYCVYSGSYKNRVHTNKRMTFEIAKEAIDYYYLHSRAADVVRIGLYGGEPLLEFDLIKKITEYCEKIFAGKELRINMTTNATLLNEKIVDFLQKHNFDLMISLDGPESVQNKSRVFADNSHGTFDVIIQKIEMIQKLYPQYLDKISFNAVIDEQNDFACSSNFFTYDFLKDAVVTAAGVSDRDSVQEVSLRETFYINYNFPGFMNGNGLNESEKIICYNQYLKYIEENEKPEVIVVGIPGELLPLTKQKPGNFGIIAYEILNAVDPDFTILSLYKDEYKEEYFEEMNNLLHYRYNVDADCFYLCNCSIDRFSINSVLPIKYLEHKNEEIEAQCIQYVHRVYCKNTYLDMTDFLIETLTGYNEIQIF